MIDSSAFFSQPAGDSRRLGVWSQDWVDAFVRCAQCAGRELACDNDAITCRSCGHKLPLADDGVLRALPEQAPAPLADKHDDVGSRVRRFYEEHPFPNYDGFESVGDLLARASRSVYAAMLDQQIPIGARVLEVGCGTGQLGLFLSVGGRAVVGVDMTRASLRLAAGFASRHGLRDCRFVHASLFDLPLASESFDLVICKGVLHHTAAPREGLQALLRTLRPGGYVICGLYNHIARIPTSMRRLWFRIARGKPANVDVVLRDLARSDQKAISWYLDQYAHPHESRHSVDEVLRWFEENDIEFLQSAPRLRLQDSFDASSPLFRKLPRGTRLSRIATQLRWMFTIGREGALFDMIGRKRGGQES